MENGRYFDDAYSLSSANIGFEFEFFSSMMKGRLAQIISKELGKKVHVSEKYHSNIPVDRNNFKLEADFSGGSDMVELVTGPMPYQEAIPVLYKILNIIKEYGYTTDKCAFQFNVSFDEMRKDVKTPIQHMDKLKFVLSLDEGLIYDKFGSRFGNVYAKSIKRVIPRNRYSILENIQSIDPMMFRLPNEKYYGVNFTKLNDGYLEFRYLGGRDYEKKGSQIVKVMDYIILHLYNQLSEKSSSYTKKDVEVLQSMMHQYKKVVRSFSNPDLFFMNFPDIHIMVDLKGWDENIKTLWINIRDKIFDLIVEGGLRSGYFNYDTSIGRFQVKDGDFKDGMIIDGIDMVDCKVKRCSLKDCRIFYSDITNSEILESQLFNSNRIEKSKIKDTSIEYTNTCKDCYIDSKGKRIGGKLIGGVLRNGNVSESAEISQKTKIVKTKDEDRQFIPNKAFTNDNLSPVKVQKFKDLNY
jgi:hypothetical protein